MQFIIKILKEAKNCDTNKMIIEKYDINERVFY